MDLDHPTFAFSVCGQHTRFTPDMSSVYGLVQRFQPAANAPFATIVNVRRFRSTHPHPREHLLAGWRRLRRTARLDETKEHTDFFVPVLVLDVEGAVRATGSDGTRGPVEHGAQQHGL